MSVPVIAFFNNKGGVGKTSLVYHISWMLADQGLRVVATDLDPQGNLSAAFLNDDRLEELWFEQSRNKTIFGAVRPIKVGTGDIESPLLEPIADRLALLKHYRSLMPMAHEAGKPVFYLKPADGALGAHIYAVQDAYKDFRTLTCKILQRAGICHDSIG